MPKNTNINKHRYLTTTICGESCPCPDSVVVLLFWIGEEAVLRFDKELFKNFKGTEKKVQQKANAADLSKRSKKSLVYNISWKVTSDRKPLSGAVVG